MGERRRHIAGLMGLDGLPPAGVVTALLAVASAVAALAWPSSVPEGRSLWTSARLHEVIYRPILAEWNERSEPKVHVTLMSLPALERRMLAGFLSETPCADLLEVERRIAARAFTGPLESVGFVDLTERVRSEGLLEQINAASFSPWSSRGRIFGLPHDVHPVMLGYRADIVEAAGIDVSGIETWEDFVRVLSPLMKERDEAGRPRRYLLNLWQTQGETIEALVLQAGGGFFDEDGRAVIASERNARTLAQIVAWTTGPERIAAEAPDFSASGNRLKLEGYVIASVMPDWMCSIWKNEIPQLAGKVKLMPLPAWERGGRRTSVWGGTMLGISKTARDSEELWRIAKHLYLSPEMARATYREGDIITPVKALWSDPVFAEEDPYFCGQRKGLMYIGLAPDVPVRPASPYNYAAMLAVQDAVGALTADAKAAGRYEVEWLVPAARRRLGEAQARIERMIARNVFLRERAVSAAGGGVDREGGGL
ncbi:MAG: extracellular solute-binding protein [Phycisphaerae bacterium]|nr:extracellular solute-binding protein [Phycisphaerae bacterium]